MVLTIDEHSNSPTPSILLSLFFMGTVTLTDNLLLLEELFDDVSFGFFLSTIRLL